MGVNYRGSAGGGGGGAIYGAVAPCPGSRLSGIKQDAMYVLRFFNWQLEKGNTSAAPTTASAGVCLSADVSELHT